LRIWSSRNPRRDNPHFGRTILGMVHRVPKRGRKHLQNWPAMTSSSCPGCNAHANTIADNAELCYNHTLKARPSPNRGFPAYIAPFGSKHEPALLLTYSNSICSIFRGGAARLTLLPSKKTLGEMCSPRIGGQGVFPKPKGLSQVIEMIPTIYRKEGTCLVQVLAQSRALVGQNVGTLLSSSCFSLPF